MSIRIPVSRPFPPIAFPSLSFLPINEITVYQKKKNNNNNNKQIKTESDMLLQALCVEILIGFQTFLKADRQVILEEKQKT